MRPIAAIIVVVFGVCSITTAARAESSTCKQCRDQQQACAKNYSAKTCKTEYDICMKTSQKKITGSLSRYSDKALAWKLGTRSSCGERTYWQRKAFEQRPKVRERP